MSSMLALAVQAAALGVATCNDRQVCALAAGMTRPVLTQLRAGQAKVMSMLARD